MSKYWTGGATERKSKIIEEAMIIWVVMNCYRKFFFTVFSKISVYFYFCPRLPFSHFSSIFFPNYWFFCFTYPVLKEPKFGPRHLFTTSPPCFKKYQFICPSNSITLLYWFEFIKVSTEFSSFLRSFILAFVFLNSSLFCQFFNLFKVIFLS